MQATTVSLPFDRAALDEMVAARYVSTQKHPTRDLHIYNYTPSCAYGKHWNEVTRACRGLILDGAGDVVQRPFPKFFNLGEHTVEIPPGPFEVYEKMDGSLGILYWNGDEPRLATRGSFISHQSTSGSQILHEDYAHTFDRLDRSLTYLFEIIYPANRIVVDYGDREDIVLLAVIDTATGRDVPLSDFADLGFPLVERYDGLADLHALAALSEPNREGFVVHFPTAGLRLKVKFEEYVTLHRLVTGVTEKRIWERLRDGIPIQNLKGNASPDYQRWVEDAVTRLTAEFGAIEAECNGAFLLVDPTWDRKMAAAYITRQRYPAVLFKMLDGRDPSEIIWKLIRPEHTRPFKIEV